MFQGLPSKCLAHQPYQNIVPSESLTHVDPTTSAAGCFQSFDRSNHQWWGADLTLTPLGKGTVIVSMFRISDNLGTDPAADRLLFNCLAL